MSKNFRINPTGPAGKAESTVQAKSTDDALFGSLLAESLGDNTSASLLSSESFAIEFTEQFLSQRGIDSGTVQTVSEKLKLINEPGIQKDSIKFMQATIDLVETISKNVPSDVITDFSAELLRQKEVINQEDGQTLI